MVLNHPWRGWPWINSDSQEVKCHGKRISRLSTVQHRGAPQDSNALGRLRKLRGPVKSGGRCRDWPQPNLSLSTLDFTDELWEGVESTSTLLHTPWASWVWTKMQQGWHWGLPWLAPLMHSPDMSMRFRSRTAPVRVCPSLRHSARVPSIFPTSLLSWPTLGLDLKCYSLGEFLHDAGNRFKTSMDLVPISKLICLTFLLKFQCLQGRAWSC